MKALIAILIIVGAAYGGWQIYSYWTQVDAKDKAKTEEAPPPISGNQLPGMSPKLDSALEAAMRKGATGLKQFLLQYGQTIRDPRLASIELDYVVLVARGNPAEAKKVFARVKQRTTATSPVYERVKQLEKTYE
ncbi:MAG: hypothetical protein ABI042_09760 [Verrucomicrobiota bacterium]